MSEPLAALPPLRESLAAHGLLARKSFGQHFLLDLNITRKIARLAAVGAGDRVIEVGPGPGGLTRALLETGADVVAVEKDERFRPLLEELAAASPGLGLVFADALAVDEAALAQGAPAHVVSNLPYNVGTPLLIKWLTGPWTPASLTLMFQKEVADRIAARPGEAAYGRLSVLAQAACAAQRVMDVPARAFTPPPKVDSAVVRLVPRPDRPDAATLRALEQVTAAAFGQRRKMLRSSLKALGGDAFVTAAGIDPQARAETVDLAGFLRLAAGVRLARPDSSALREAPGPRG
jgi:16S rRNA (adenine1518-N6/adenine1519-N6)-dimethyltransferase